MASAFSSNEQATLERSLHLDDADGDVIDFDQDLSIDDTILWLNNLDPPPRILALQMPDSLLHHAVRLFGIFKKRLSAETKVYILADTTYASCCIDVVAASHINADALVHYGDCCLSEPPAKIRVYYVYPKAKFDASKATEILRENLKSTEAKSVLLVYELRFQKFIASIRAILEKDFQQMNIELISLDPNISQTDSQSIHTLMGRSTDTSAEIINSQDTTLLFIGGEDSTLLSLVQWSYPSISNTIIFNPKTMKYQTASTSTYAALRRRLYLVQKVRDANTIGIVCSTVGINNHVAVVERLKDLCRAAGKTYYLLSVGKLNVAKLANFAVDVEAFVNFSCPFGILNQQQIKEHTRPIATIFEAAMALSHECSWSADRPYRIDANVVFDVEPLKSELDDTNVSLIDGRVRSNRRICEESSSDGKAVILYTSPAEIFTNRSWRGLDEGLDSVQAVSDVKQGRKGVAAMYDNEHM